MIGPCPWCSRYFREQDAEKYYWHIKIHNATEEAERLIEEKNRRNQNKEVNTSEV